MKKFFYCLFTLCLIFGFYQISNARTSHTLLSQLDLEGFNEEQKEMIKKEVDAYSSEIDHLYEADKEEYKSKIHQLFQKLAFGFKIYRLAADNKALEDSLDSFFGKTNLRVYVVSFVEGAFLNNLFQRLAELRYNLKENKAIEIKFRFRNIGEGVEEDVFNYEAQVLSTEAVKDTLRNALRKKLKEQSEIENNLKTLYASVDGKNIAVFQYTSYAEISSKVNEILERFDDLGLKEGPLLGYLDCQKFCNMCVAQKCAYLMMKQFNQYGFGKYLIVEHDKKYIFSGTIKIDEVTSFDIEKEFLNEKSYFKDYEEYLEAWNVPYIYRSLLDYPKTEWNDYIPWDGKNNNCFVHCTEKITENPPPVVKFIAEVITSPYTSPGKIIYGKNFIFQDEEVSTLDRGLAFLDIPGVGTVSRNILIKLGAKSFKGKILNTLGVIDGIIKNSRVSETISILAKSAINSLPDAKKVFVLNGLANDIIKVEEIPAFVQAIKNAASDNWDDILKSWEKTKSILYKVIKVSKPIEFWWRDS